jgi:ABC-type sugar transport system substrate-binding protein
VVVTDSPTFSHLYKKRIIDEGSSTREAGDSCVEREVPRAREVTVKKPKVVVTLLSEDQEFQLVQAEDARAAGNRLGLDTQVPFAEGNPVVQIQQLFRFIHARDEHPLAIVVESTTGEGLEHVARNAVKAGILSATVRIPSNTGPALDLPAAWVQSRKPLPAEMLLSPTSFPSESRIVRHRTIHEGACVVPPAP